MKSIIVIISAFCWLIILNVYAQEAPAWSASFEGNYQWMDIHSTGIVLVQSSEGLYGIDPDTKSVKWHLENMPSDDLADFTDVEGTPFIKIHKESSIPGADRTNILDAYRGVCLFDTDSSNIKKIKFMRVLHPINALYIQGKTNEGWTSRLVDLTDGHKLWEASFESDKTGMGKFMNKLGTGLVADIEDQARYPHTNVNGNLIFALPEQDKLLKLDRKSGEILWEKEVGKAENIFMSSDRDVAFVTVKEVEKADKEGKKWGGRMLANVGTGLKNFIKASTLIALDADSGDEIWRQTINNYNFHILYPNGMMLGSSGNLKLIDYHTGETIEKYDIEAGEQITYFRYLEDKVMISSTYYKDENNTYNCLYLFDREGNKVWKSSTDIWGSFYQFETIGEHAIYLMTHGYLMVYDLNTGQARTEDPYGFAYHDKQGWLPKLVLKSERENSVIVYNDDKIQKIDAGTGVPALLIEDIKFRGGKTEVPYSLEETENGYLLASSQNLLSFDQDGNIIYQRYHPKPGRFGKGLARMGKKLAIATAYTAASLIIMDAYYSNPEFRETSDAVNEFNAEMASLKKELTNNVNKVGDYATTPLTITGVASPFGINSMTTRVNDRIEMINSRNLAAKLNPALEFSYELVAERQNETFRKKPDKYVFAKLEKTEGLYQISAEDNTEQKFIPFNDKSPDYEIDDINNKLYFLSDQGKISVFEL